MGKTEFLKVTQVYRLGVKRTGDSVANLCFIRPVIKRGNSKLTYRPTFHKSVKTLDGMPGC
jgi:hypothetical protein